MKQPKNPLLTSQGALRGQCNTSTTIMLAREGLEALRGEETRVFNQVTALVQEYSAELRRSAGIVDEILDDVEKLWPSSDLEWRARTIAIADGFSAFIQETGKKDDWPLLALANEEIAKVFQQDWSRFVRAVEKVREAIASQAKAEVKRSKDLTALVVSSAPGGFDGIMQRVEKARDAFKAGKFKRFTADHLSEKARSCSQ